MVETSILLAHGGGGALTRELLEESILPALGSATSKLPDAAPLPLEGNLAMTTDSFVVKPLFFRGGDIGSLSVHGTVNDLAVSGARPVALSMALIIEEGFSIEELSRIISSAARAARECNVQIVTGDTKVVAHGEADGLFINTTGIGVRIIEPRPDALKPGDSVIVSGSIAEHGIAVLSQREGIDFETEVKSDSAPVWPMVKALIDAKVEIHAMRDPTRGGLAACCVELAEDSAVSIELYESAIPVHADVRGACELLGLDPLTVANEGKLVAFVPERDAAKALEVLRSLGEGKESRIIGKVQERQRLPVSLKTRYGGSRIVEMPYGEELPRIC